MNKIDLNVANTKSYVPDSSGVIPHAVMGPCEVNWPTASSRKNNGRATSTVRIMYGRRKAAIKTRL